MKNGPRLAHPKSVASDGGLRTAAHIAFIGTVGVPNRYGGFEAFLEQCAPEIVRRGYKVTVTCEGARYPDALEDFEGVTRCFIPVRANGAASILHDLLAFLTVWPQATHIVVLGVSGGVWFPLFRLLCAIRGTVLAVNVDGVEWLRGKFGRGRRAILKLFDILAQMCAHRIIIDNAGLEPFLISSASAKAVTIAYPGDHVLRIKTVKQESRAALTICRIEPENNIGMLLAAAEASQIERYTLIGNWSSSEFGRNLRARHSGSAKLRLLDAIYDPDLLAAERERCAVYIHGHSVGGTNPSLVEMLFYDCEIVCFDVSFHHYTAGSTARYFSTEADLTRLLDEPRAVDSTIRRNVRGPYLRAIIAEEYCRALKL